ncbi:MAG: DEAD/DEAH box helicase family protein [Clostridiaceae bacterium]|nr:DEAD/DEAH box helicase family protein [Clostridiaceae bacterium]
MKDYKKLLQDYEKLKLEYEKLRKENQSLKEKINTLQTPNSSSNSIAVSKEEKQFNKEETITLQSTAHHKIQLYRNLFRGREDVYALRWQSIKTNKSGYSPACGNEWKAGICRKPKMKCSQCSHRVYLNLTDKTIYEHLSRENRKTIGIYPLLQDETCYFLAVDFDKATWQEDVGAFLETCREEGISASVEKSRSGNGAHIWIFFKEPIAARKARRLGDLLLTLTLERRHQMGLDSYDRFFPNQDTLPKGGLGNLIALPLQGIPRKQGNSVFVDENLIPFKDQWSYLSSIQRLTKIEVEEAIKNLERNTKNSFGNHLNIVDTKIKNTQLLSSCDLDDKQQYKIDEALPAEIKIIFRDLLYIEKHNLPPKLINHLIRTAVFNNPEFYRTQAMRLPTFNKPRVIDCSENNDKLLGLPRGCLDKVKDILETNKVDVNIVDKRNKGIAIDVDFTGKLSEQQLKAAESLYANEQGVLSAATGFGKTVIASWLIGKRNTNTLIIVHRAQLMEQWKERLGTFLNIEGSDIGEVGGGKSKRTGIIDVAMMQSLVGKNNVQGFIKEYGQVIVDECHHVSAFSFEKVMKKINAKFVHGLTATPTRKDGHHPIVIMQCGEIIYKVSTRNMVAHNNIKHKVIPRHTNLLDFEGISQRKISIQDYYKKIISDEGRNDMIFNDVLNEIEKGSTPLLLTERTTHVEYFQEKFKGFVKNIIVLRGGMGKKQRQTVETQLSSIGENEERLIIATGKYIGEGFDDKRLDCLFLAMPISWKGTLQQYAGRLHRTHIHKEKVQIYDYVDSNIPMLLKMYKKRVKRYENMGYEMEDDNLTC